jgi:hypothetical protein
VIFFDEADCLHNGTLISFLRQLRNGYVTRSVSPFVHSLALIGMRNIRDFKAHIRPDRETPGGASPFNVVTKAFTLSNFTRRQIEEFYAQHTVESGQIFEPGVVDLIFEKTRGQPWLVNAIAREVVIELLRRDYSKPVTARLCEQAINNILLRRDVHIDSLLERLKEERVRNVIEPMLLGEDVKRSTDDFAYVNDLGLVRIDEVGDLVPANPIYAEVIARTLNAGEQERIGYADENAVYQMPRYLKDGNIVMDFLLSIFQQFWRENAEICIGRNARNQEQVTGQAAYTEAVPHLTLMAFFQRVINGGGHIIREFAAGSRRLDLCLMYQGKKYPIELKLHRSEKTLAEGITQLTAYMDKLGEKQGWLCIFDRDKNRPWEEKIFRKTTPVGDIPETRKTISIFGL